MDKLMGLFVVAMVLCGCALDGAPDKPVNMAVVVIALLVATACAWVLGRNEDGTDNK